MRVKNVSDHAREIDDVGGVPLTAAVGEVIDVPDDLGASLCEQPANWAPADEVSTGDDKQSKRGKAASSDEEQS